MAGRLTSAEVRPQRVHSLCGQADWVGGLGGGGNPKELSTFYEWIKKHPIRMNGVRCFIILIYT